MDKFWHNTLNYYVSASKKKKPVMKANRQTTKAKISWLAETLEMNYYRRKTKMHIHCISHLIIIIRLYKLTLSSPSVINT